MNTLNSVSQDSGARQKEKSNSAGINGDGEIINLGEQEPQRAECQHTTKSDSRFKG
jgi:hypothetical protein